MDARQTDFLNAHKMHVRIYVTGMFYSGITIYNQQVRTLNLIYYLTKNKKIRRKGEADRVIIIGGGVSGLTASIAFKRLGFNVTLLEEKSLLLHLQHGCTTRQIHPNLFLWPRVDSLKPFTELPFANWTAGDAATIEKTLIKELNTELKDGKIEVIYNVTNLKVDVKKRLVTVLTPSVSKSIPLSFDLLLLATGFGLEKYVGKKEITKSYWRNEDFGQLRIKDQLKNFFISGVGDGGVSDVFRLALTAFDPIEMAKKFEELKKGNVTLIDRLRQIDDFAHSLPDYNYHSDFENVFDDFKNELEGLFQKKERSDVKTIVLNGKDDFKTILSKGRMSFINAWLLLVLKQLNLFEYHKGQFPDDCGKYIFTDGHSEEFQVIVRHGTDKNMDKFKAMCDLFGERLDDLEGLQRQKSLNAFSTSRHWDLEYWDKAAPGSYRPKKYFVSNALDSYCSVFLKTLEGLIRNYASEGIATNLSFRMTLHRLVFYSDHYYFQQVSKYVGDRIDGDVGRAFPINEGIVGLAMRTNSCCSLVRNMDVNKNDLFDYDKIFARPLSDGVKSFFVVPIPNLIMSTAVLCLYIDTNEEKLVSTDQFRKIIYWSLTSFIKDVDSKNVEEREILDWISPDKNKDNRILTKTPGINNYDSELKPYWDNGLLRMHSNRLIDIYAK